MPRFTHVYSMRVVGKQRSAAATSDTEYPLPEHREASDSNLENMCSKAMLHVKTCSVDCTDVLEAIDQTVPFHQDVTGVQDFKCPDGRLLERVNYASRIRLRTDIAKT